MLSPTPVAGLLSVADLPKSSPLTFILDVSSEMEARIVAALELLELRKLRLTGELSPHGSTDWRLKAQLGATVGQSCIATAQLVRTRIDIELDRVFVANWAAHVPEVAEAEMPEDDRFDPLGDTIDLELLLTEALALALPDYPRSADAVAVEMTAAPPGVAAIDDEDTKPFAALADLKRKLEDKS